MILPLKVLLIILLIFIAIALACAVRLAIGRRGSAPADPFAMPFGDVSEPPRRKRIPAGVALRPDAGSGRLSVLSGDAAARASFATRSVVDLDIERRARRAY
jgi:hypothetical protein